MTVLAQFPLESVLLPGMPLGLHVFESRYLQLLDDVASVDGRFGVVMITRGSEVGGADQRAEVGTIAEIVARTPASDNRWLVEAVGIERFRITRWLDDDPYPRAEIEPWTQLMGNSAAGDLANAKDRFDTFLTLVSELGADVAAVDVPEDGVEALYGMAIAAPLAVHDRYRMLAAGDGAEAARILVDALEGLIEVVQFRLQGG